MTVGFEFEIWQQVTTSYQMFQKYDIRVLELYSRACFLTSNLKSHIKVWEEPVNGAHFNN